MPADGATGMWPPKSARFCRGSSPGVGPVVEAKRGHFGLHREAPFWHEGGGITAPPNTRG
jgi:hypothetical protein